jgi:hypothetical protein
MKSLRFGSPVEDEGLLAMDGEAAGHSLGAGRDRVGSETCSFLVGEGDDPLARGDTRQHRLAQRIGPAQEHRPGAEHAGEQRRRHEVSPELLGDDAELGAPEAGAAPPLRQHHPREAEASHLEPQVAREPDWVLCVAQRTQVRDGRALADERPRRLADRLALLVGHVRHRRS